MIDQDFLDIAIATAREGLAEGGDPIGASLVSAGRILATGRNQRVQLRSVIRHAETDCLENAGRLDIEVFRQSTLYTTMSPCFMCAGAIMVCQIPRVVVGQAIRHNGGEQLLRDQGVTVINIDDPECAELAAEYGERTVAY